MNDKSKIKVATELIKILYYETDSTAMTPMCKLNKYVLNAHH